MTTDEVKQAGDILIENGTAIFEKLHDRLDNQLNRTMQTIDDIKKLCKDQAIDLPELNLAIEDCNELKIFKARLANYLREVKDDRNSTDKKFAIISVMVELSETINNKVDQRVLVMTESSKVKLNGAAFGAILRKYLIEHSSRRLNFLYWQAKGKPRL